MEFEKAIEYVLSKEGGYVNNPNDAGGETKFGISKRAFPKVNIPELTREGAIALYKEHYWKKLRCDEMPQNINLHVLDFGVHAGVPICIKMIQRLMGTKEDGIIGGATISGAKKITPWIFAGGRTTHYVGIVKSKPSQIEFLNGWILRVLHITEICLAE